MDDLAQWGALVAVADDEMEGALAGGLAAWGALAAAPDGDDAAGDVCAWGALAVARPNFALAPGPIGHVGDQERTM